VSCVQIVRLLGVRDANLVADRLVVWGDTALFDLCLEYRGYHEHPVCRDCPFFREYPVVPVSPGDPEPSSRASHADPVHLACLCLVDPENLCPSPSLDKRRHGNHEGRASLAGLLCLVDLGRESLGKMASDHSSHRIDGPSRDNLFHVPCLSRDHSPSLCEYGSRRFACRLLDF
jgi:hypothetical protein